MATDRVGLPFLQKTEKEYLIGRDYLLKNKYIDIKIIYQIIVEKKPMQ